MAAPISGLNADARVAAWPVGGADAAESYWDGDPCGGVRLTTIRSTVWWIVNRSSSAAATDHVESRSTSILVAADFPLKLTSLSVCCRVWTAKDWPTLSFHR